MIDDNNFQFHNTLYTCGRRTVRHRNTNMASPSIKGLTRRNAHSLQMEIATVVLRRRRGKILAMVKALHRDFGDSPPTQTQRERERERDI